MASRPSEKLVILADPLGINAVVQAASSLGADEFFERSSDGDVRELSSNTIFEALEIVPEAILLNDDGAFEAAATVHVTLNYGGSRDAASMPDSYPAIVKGELQDGIAEISEVSVDTGGFYA